MWSAHQMEEAIVSQTLHNQLHKSAFHLALGPCLKRPRTHPEFATSAVTGRGWLLHFTFTPLYWPFLCKRVV